MSPLPASRRRPGPVSTGSSVALHGTGGGHILRPRMSYAPRSPADARPPTPALTTDVPAEQVEIEVEVEQLLAAVRDRFPDADT